MRSYNNLYEPMLQDDYIKQRFINASKKKKNRNDVREVLENLDEHTELLKKMLTEELFIPDYHKPSIINESSSKKTQELYYDEYYYPDDEFAERMSVVVWFILSLGCAILWVGIPLLICGLIVYTELEEHCPELMGDMTDRNTEEFDKEENK